MRSLKKALSLLLVMAMLCSSVVFAASFPDVESSASYAEAVDVLSAFGIINGYEDGTFRPDNDVTRAEFTAMLVRSLNLSGIGSADPADLPFSDLGEAAWAVSDIHTAYTKGIINGMGDGTFAPNNNVTYEQAIKMVVCALGYEAMAKDSVAAGLDVYPTGYINVATELALTTKVNGVMGANMKRWQNAQLIYNSFLVDIMTPVNSAAGITYRIDPGKNLLSEYLKMYKRNGTVQADNKSSVSASGTLVRSGEVLIYDNSDKEEIIYDAGGFDVSGLVGKSVTFYYKLDTEGDRVLTYIASNMSEDSEISVDADLVVEMSGSYDNGFTLEYFEKLGEKKTLNVKIPGEARFLLNNEEMTKGEVNSFDFADGEYTMTLLDSSNSGTYDIVRISQYETYVVKSTSASTMTIVDRFKTTQNSYKIDEDDALKTYKYTRTDGASMSFSNIAAWNVLSIMEETTANGRTTVEVIISSESVTGEVTGVGEDYIEIDEKEYPISAYFTNYYETSSDGGRVYSGDSGTFYLDKDGKIVAVNKTTSNSSSYGFIAAASYEKSSDRTRMAFFKSSSTSMSTSVYTAKKVKIDGESYSADEVPDILADVLMSDEADYINLDGAVLDDNIYSQVVKFSTNSSGEINTIDTIVMSADEDMRGASEYLTPSEYNDANAQWDYTTSNRTFTSGNKTFKIDANTLVLTLPEDRGEYDDYSKKSVSFFDNYTKYTLEAYDIDSTTSIAKVLVVYADNIDAQVNVNSPVFIVTRKISETRNDEGDIVQAAEGYLSTKGGGPSDITTVYCSGTGVLDDVEIGDAIRYGVDASGAILDGTVEIVFSPSYLEPIGFDQYTHINSDDKITVKDVTIDNQANESIVAATFRMYAGYVYSVDGTNGSLTVAICDDPAACEDEDVRKTSYDVKSGTKFVIYDSAASESNAVQYQEDAGTDFQLETIENYIANGEDACPVFVHAGSGTMRTVYIVK